MKNLNPYDQEQFQAEFETTQTFQALKQKYNRVSFDKFFENNRMLPTPRHIYAGGYPTEVSAVPWYYLNYLNNSKLVVDLGCGVNFFKPYFSNFVGIGAENQDSAFFGDLHDFVDDDFYKEHIGAYDSVFSINALHFQPLKNLRNICINFSNILKPGGRGFLSLNVKRMLEQAYFKHLLSTDLDSWVRGQLTNFPEKILVLDIDFSVLDAWMDGNIRIVFEKS